MGWGRGSRIGSRASGDTGSGWTAARRGALIGLLVLGAVAGGGLAATAFGARYHVYACHGPRGEVAPIDGWVGTTDGPYTYAIDDCGAVAPYALTAAIDGAVAHAANASDAIWTFSTAPDLTLAAATLFRHEAVPGGSGTGASYVTYLAAPELRYDGADVLDNCQANLGCTALGSSNGGFDPSNRIPVPVAGANHVYMVANCGGIDGQTCPPSAGYAAVAELYAADLTLADDTAPAPDNVGGTLVSGGTLSGAVDVTFAATDAGSGVYSGGLSVDGTPVSSEVLDPNGGRCRIVGEATDGLRDFRYQTPCRTSTHADLGLDTGLLADGRHTVAVTVDDAAGNLSTVWSGSIVTRNAPQGGIPQVNGVLAQGQRLMANPGTWAPAPTAFTYQWLRCTASPPACRPISGAVGDVYLPTFADAYQLLAVDVTAYDAAGATTVRSAAVGPVADPNGSTSGGSVTAQSGGLTGATAGRPPGGGGAPGGAGAPGGGGAGAAAGGGPVHQPNGSGGCAAAHLSAAFGSSAVGRVGLAGGATLRGKLDCAGRPVAMAAVEVAVARQGDRGAPGRYVVRTAADGSFSTAVGPGPSRVLTLSYRAFSDAAAPAATASVRLEVTPSISLSIRPVHVRNGQTITYRGRVFGGYIPATGLPVALEYRDGHRWRTFDQTWARAPDGGFSYRYTFRRTTIPIVYTFRVAITAIGLTGYPYAPATSRVKSVRVDP